MSCNTLFFYIPLFVALEHPVTCFDQNEWNGGHLSRAAWVSCCVLSVRDDESMHLSRFVNFDLALGWIYNVDTRCEFHYLDQASNVFQDVEIIDRTKRGSPHKHLSTSAQSSGYECFCLKEKYIIKTVLLIEWQEMFTLYG